MADVIRTALDAHQLDSRVTYGRVIVWCIADECAWHCWPAGAALGAAVDGLHAALVAGRAAHRAHQAEVATTAVLEVTQRVLEGWVMPYWARGAQYGIAAALAGEG